MSVGMKVFVVQLMMIASVELQIRERRELMPNDSEYISESTKHLLHRKIRIIQMN